ncbi:GHKL domain-containing protein [Lactiplantibacillus garii]|uniref:GHKL domain-containing protein n=1 Tax=Lactiplantibacillus garii TaxID=2306423 RepID=A0A426D6G2_9LACO|nr:GHKL domain-containing protein [Lactiplantibacillus garii]RRK10215.1 GHKL domain-containing protein [Lactiplantibacillus garii]
MSVGWLYVLTYISGTYEFLFMIITFREYLTWKIGLVWFGLVVGVCLVLFPAISSLLPGVPLVFFYIIPLVVTTTVMSSKMLQTNWLLMLPLAIFLNAAKRLIGAIFGNLVKYLTQSTSPMLTQQVLHLQRVEDLNLFWAVVIGLPFIIILALAAHHWVVKVSAADFLRRTRVERSDYLLVSLCFIMYIFVYTFAMESSITNQTYAAIVASIVFGGVGLYLVLNKSSRLNDQQLMDSLGKYNQLLSHHNQTLHLFKHDYENILLSLAHFIETRDIDGLSRYFKAEIEPTKELFGENTGLSSLRFLEIPELNGLIYSKYDEALARHVDLRILVLERVKLVDQPLVPVIRILGNLLDNAIDAAESADHVVRLTIDPSTPNQLRFSVQNQVAPGTDVDLQKLSKSRYTTKPGHLGYGLQSIQSLTNAHVQVHYQVQDQTFSATLTLTASH